MAIIMNNLVDIHNHSLPNVDDGANSIEEAVQNLKILKNLGYKEIVLTSHYIIDSLYKHNIASRLIVFEELKEALKDEDIKIHLGNEVFITDSDKLQSLLKNKEIATLNNSKYLLIELPFRNKIHNLEQIICDLNSMGIVPIIAHPERYAYFRNGLDYLKIILEYDCYLQGNLGSLVGKYGSEAKKLLIKLLKNNMISFIATDTHHLKNDTDFKKAIKILRKKVSEEQARKLLVDNPRKVIQNKSLN